MKLFKLNFKYHITKNTLYITAFLIPVLLMTAVFAVQRIYPFGDRSFLHIDMYHQYFPFLTEFYHKLKEGDSLFYSWKAGLGSNFLSLYAYYLASPFNWLCILVPEKFLMEFQSYMVILKIGFCGLTSCYYFRHHFDKKTPVFLFFSTFYALSGFMAAYNWNVMWLDVIWLAPLVVLGLEKLAESGKYRLYCISLTLAVLSNFYLSMLLCIYLVLYFLLVLLPEANAKLRAILQFTGFSLLSGGMSAVLLLPEAAALRLSEFSNASFPSNFKSYFSVFDILARHSMDVAVETGLDHWPNLYCGVAVLFLLPLYILSKSIPVKQKIGKLLLLGFLLLSFSSNVLTFLWHGFNYPDSLPCRQSFLYILLLLTLCAESLLSIREFSKTELTYVVSGCFVFLILCQKLVTDEALTDRSLLLSALFLAGFSLLVYSYRKTARLTPILLSASLFLVMLESGLNTYLTSCPTVSRDKYLSDYASYRPLVAETTEESTLFERYERDARVTNNDALLFGYPSASCFSSTINGLVTAFYENYGLKSSKVFYNFDGATPLTAALLQVPYSISAKADRSDDLQEQTATKGNLHLYRKNLTLPFGYVISEGSLQFADSSLAPELVAHGVSPSENPLEHQNLLAEKLGSSEILFTAVEIENQGSASTLTIEENGHYYAFSENKKATAATATVDTEYKTSSEEMKFTKMKNRHILDLGYRTKGDTVHLTSDDDQPLNLVAYRFEEASLENLFTDLSSQSFQIETFTSTKVDGTVTASASGHLVLSIPYEPGWTVTVDNAVTEPKLFEGMLLAIPVNAGTHEIALTYVSEGFYPGCLLSLLSLSIYGLLHCIQQKESKNACFFVKKFYLLSFLSTTYRSPS